MHVSLSNSLAGQCTNIFHSEYTSRLYFSLEASPYITLLIFFLIEIFFIELSDCPHGWTNVAGKCFKLICREYSWRNARVKCLKAQADLASLHDENSLRSITQYLERILAHLSDSTLLIWYGKKNMGNGILKNQRMFITTNYISA